MAFDLELAGRVRERLKSVDNVTEKRMFGGLAFLVNDKMCVNVGGNKLMCRFDPSLEKELSKKKGYEPTIMKNRKLDGYCYVNPEGVRSEDDLSYWVNLCLDFNKFAKSSKKLF